MSCVAGALSQFHFSVYTKSTVGTENMLPCEIRTLRSWAEVRTKLGRSSNEVGPKLERSWAEVRTKLGRSSNEVGPKFERSWAEVRANLDQTSTSLEL